ncbi:MAG: crossover junction endodeoxyribonuclease RuvC [Saprospiraceae bacterium]|jgi:crossover junction endodeoxyribonuclease RuvC
MKKINSIILGVDPGTNILGFCIIQVEDKSIRLIEMSVLQLKGLPDHQQKLKQIYERLQSIIDRHQPTEMAIEAPFYAKNPQSLLKLGRAQGVAIAAAVAKNLKVWEYAPKKIKQSITGNGNATKEQVAAMLQQILNIPINPKFYDATDALATAVCHTYQQGTPQFGNGQKFTSWEAFLNANPSRKKAL